MNVSAQAKVGIVTAGFMSPPCAVALNMRTLLFA